MQTVSPKFTMTQQDWERWFENQMYFLRPLGVAYFGFVGVQLKVHGPSLSNFVPDTWMLGAIEMYCLGALTDFLRKYYPEKRVDTSDTPKPSEIPSQKSTDTLPDKPTVIDTSFLQ